MDQELLTSTNKKQSKKTNLQITGEGVAAYTAKHPRILCCTLGNTADMIGAAMFVRA